MVLYYMRVIFVAYFLKKTNNKKGTYLQIYESYYDPERKGGLIALISLLGMSTSCRQVVLTTQSLFSVMKSKNSIRNTNRKNKLNRTVR